MEIFPTEINADARKMRCFINEQDSSVFSLFFGSSWKNSRAQLAKNSGDERKAQIWIFQRSWRTRWRGQVKRKQNLFFLIARFCFGNLNTINAVSVPLKWSTSSVLPKSTRIRGEQSPPFFCHIKTFAAFVFSTRVESVYNARTVQDADPFKISTIVRYILRLCEKITLKRSPAHTRARSRTMFLTFECRGDESRGGASMIVEQEAGDLHLMRASFRSWIFKRAFVVASKLKTSSVHKFKLWCYLKLLLYGVYTYVPRIRVYLVRTYVPGPHKYTCARRDAVYTTFFHPFLPTSCFPQLGMLTVNIFNKPSLYPPSPPQGTKTKIFPQLFTILSLFWNREYATFQLTLEVIRLLAFK